MSSGRPGVEDPDSKTSGRTRRDRFGVAVLHSLPRDHVVSIQRPRDQETVRNQEAVRCEGWYLYRGVVSLPRDGIPITHTMCARLKQKPCIRRLFVYTDTLAGWVYRYVDLAWLCLRIRRLGGSCLRILSTDTTGIHVALGP